MKPLFCAAALAAAYLVVSNPAEAVDYKGQFTSLSPANFSCGSWLAHHNNPNEWIIAQAEDFWVVGFLNGAGYEGPPGLDPLHGVDAEGLYAWISNYCATRPIASIMDATTAFIEFHPH